MPKASWVTHPPLNGACRPKCTLEATGCLSRQAFRTPAGFAPTCHFGAGFVLLGDGMRLGWTVDGIVWRFSRQVHDRRRARSTQGDNQAGAVGDGTLTDRTPPTLVGAAFAPWAYVSAGRQYTCAINVNGSSYCWVRQELAGMVVVVVVVTRHHDDAPRDLSTTQGDNTSGVLGIGTTVAKTTPTALGGTAGQFASISTGVATTCGVIGSPLVPNTSATPPAPLPPVQPICWVRGAAHQADLGARPRRPRPRPTPKLSAGNQLSVPVWGWLLGRGAAGTPYVGSRHMGPAVAGRRLSVFHNQRGTCLLLGERHRWHRIPREWAHWLELRPEGGAGRFKLDCDIRIAVARVRDRLQRLPPLLGKQCMPSGWRCCSPSVPHGDRFGLASRVQGQNDRYQVGDGTAVTRLSPVLINASISWAVLPPRGTGDGTSTHTCAIDTSARLACWVRWPAEQLPQLTALQLSRSTLLRSQGTNGYGQIGVNSSVTPIKVPTLVVGGGLWTSVAVGNSHSCAIADSTRLYCWVGQLPEFLQSVRRTGK